MNASDMGSIINRIAKEKSMYILLAVVVLGIAACTSHYYFKGDNFVEDEAIELMEDELKLPKDSIKNVVDPKK